MRADEPPLWTWGAAVLLAGLCVGVCWLCVLRFEPAFKSLYLNMDRLSAGSASEPLVVFIGSSKTRCAVEADSRLQARFAALGTPVRVVRFTEGWATARDFESLFDVLPGQRPAIVAIESELIDLEPNAFRLKEMSPYRGWRERTRKVLAFLLMPGLVAHAGLENRDPKDDHCGTAEGTPEGRRKTLAQRRESTPAERAPYYALARRLRSAGVPAVFLQLPSRNDALGAKPARLVAGERKVRNEVLHSGLFISLGDPPAIAAAEFKDYGHLGSAGQSRFSAWLAVRLSTLLNQASRQ